MNLRSPSAPASPPPDIFQQAFRNSPVMQSVIRASDGEFLEVNQTFLTKLGFTREQVIGRKAPELGFWVDPDAPLRYKMELEERGSIRGHEVRLRGPAGDLLIVLLSSQRVTIAGEQLFVSAGVDITERKAAEAKLRESERRLRESESLFGAAFHACPGMMTIARLRDGGYVQVNDAFVEWLGHDRAAILGRSWQDFAMWEDPAAGERFFADLQRTRSLRNVECTLRQRSGRYCVLLVSAEIIAINSEPHILGFAIDITQRKQAETEQQRALEKERELSQLKTDFVSLVSHEFRTPLEVIMSSADNLDRYQDRLAPAKRRELLRTINKSVRRMSDMMEEVLLLGQMDSDRMEFKPVDFDLAAFARRLRDEMESATNGRCPIRLATKRIPARARGDESVIRHILTNLIANAVKYSPEGSAVDIEIARAKGDAIFRIVDRGCGIPAADQPRLFQAFQRAANVRHIPGTGLGLVIVRRCIELHGGALSFESAEGRGTTFTVRLRLFTATPA